MGGNSRISGFGAGVQPACRPIFDGVGAHFFVGHKTVFVGIGLVERGGQPQVAIEIKRSSAPSLERGFGQACQDLSVQQRWVVYPGTERFPLRHGAQAIGLADLAGVLRGGA